MAVITLEMALNDKEPLFAGATCRGCGDAFFDQNGRRLCDTCLCERVNGAGLLEDDDPDDVINLPAAPWSTSQDSQARAYWVEEIRLNWGPSLERLAQICTASNYSYQATVEALTQGEQA